MRRQFMQFAAMAVVCAVAGGVAFAADTIADDQAEGDALISGTVAFSTDKWDAEVDYAVYAPGQYPGEYPDEDDKDTHYIYAYQLFNDTDSDVTLSSLSIGLASGADVPDYSVWYDTTYGVSGGDIPYASWLLPLGDPTNSTSVVWHGSWIPGNYSTVLLFSSPHTYTWDSATVMNGGEGDTQSLPSPLPEPAVLILLCGGVVPILLKRRRKARVKV